MVATMTIGLVGSVVSGLMVESAAGGWIFCAGFVLGIGYAVSLNDAMKKESKDGKG